MSTPKPTPAATHPLPAPALHLVAHDAAGANGRSPEPGELTPCLRVLLDSGKCLYLHLGPETLAQLQQAAAQSPGEQAKAARAAREAPG